MGGSSIRSPPESAHTTEIGLPIGSHISEDEERHSDIEVEPSEIEELESLLEACCLITRDNEPLGGCRVLRSLTNGSSIEQLEHAWGVKKGELRFDTRHNEIALRLDLQKTFETGNWALVPHLDVLKEIATKTLLLTQSTKVRPPYTEWFPNQAYNYTFFHFRGAPNVLTRLSEDPDNSEFEIYRAPFHNVPVIQSQVHPYYVICDVAQKSFSHQFSRGNRNTPLGQVRPDLQDCVDLCAAIFSQWMSLRVPSSDVPKPLAPTRVPRGVSVVDTPLDSQDQARRQKRQRKDKVKHKASSSSIRPTLALGEFTPTVVRKQPLPETTSSSPIVHPIERLATPHLPDQV